LTPSSITPCQVAARNRPNAPKIALATNNMQNNAKENILVIDHTQVGQYIVCTNDSVSSCLEW
jgi:DeoR/GlpR family transcriptional regulator of sugar metabolism